MGEAYVLANTLRETLATKTISYQDHNILCTASFGIAQWQPDENYDHLIQKADHALYQAKHDGRNRCCLAESP